VIDRKVRAFNPAPGTQTVLDGRLIKIWTARPAAGAGAPGVMLPAGPGELVVACGSGALRVLELQRAGARRTTAAAFLAGSALPPGARFGN